MKKENNVPQGNVAANREEPRRGLFRSIRTRLIVYFCLLFTIVLAGVELVGIMGLPFTSYKGRQGEQRVEVFRGLSLVADLKKERILRSIKEWIDDTYLFSSNDLVKVNVIRLLTAIRKLKGGDLGEGAMGEGAEFWALVGKEKSYRTLLKFMNKVKTTYGAYDRIQIVDAETGTIFISTDDGDLGAYISEQPYFTGALRTRRNYVGNIVLTQGSRQTVLHISYVIKGSEGEVVAVMVVEVNAEEIIKPMLHTGEGLGERGEALLVNQDVRILTSLKHPLQDGTVAKPLQYRIKAETAILAAKGEEGIIESEDYRGEPVLAAYRHIRISPEWSWGLVVKRDRAELFAPLRTSTNHALFIGLVGIFAVVGLTILLSRDLTRPIMSLNRTADQIAGGDLDARAPVTTSDEVGHLAITFNSMIQRIQDWHRELETEVYARTTDLNKTNKELLKEIGERKLVEKDREALISELEAKNAELERFTYTASHDLKSPLITIKGFLGLLEKDVSEGNQVLMKADMKRISSAAEKMRRLLDELLELARIGRIVNPPEEASFDGLAREAVDMVQGRLGATGVKVDIASDLPLIYGDQIRLREVLENLVDNAVKFMGDKADPRIEIGVKRDDDGAIFYVRDNGIGIYPKYHEKVFGLFDKLDQSTEGTGVGLAIVKRIVEVHGGRIWVESEGVGKGTTFYFTLPDRNEIMKKEG